MSTTSAPPTTRVELVIGGMTCASCANRVERRLNRLDGVQAMVNYATEKATVQAPAGVDPAALVAAVEAVGYTATLPAPPTAAQARDPGGPDSLRPLRQRLIGSTVLALPVIALAMVPALQFEYWQWISLALAGPVAVWGPRRSTGRPGRTCDTRRPPWTPWCRWGSRPRSAGRCTHCCSAGPVCRA